MYSSNSIKALIFSLIAGFLVVIIGNYAFADPNPYLIYLIMDIVVAFVYAFVFLPKDRLHFYRYYLFHYLFSTNLVWFVGFTLVLAFIGLL